MRIYKIVTPVEKDVIEKNNNKFFDVNNCVDFTIFQSQKEVAKQAYTLKENSNYETIYYADFEVDDSDYSELVINEISILNNHITPHMDYGIIKNIHLIEVFKYNGEIITISTCLTDDLKKYGVVFNDDYFSFVYSYKSPYRHGSYDLFMADAYNKRYKEKFGRIVVYKETPEFYESVFDAVINNYDKKYKFGFEKLHSQGILPKNKKKRIARNFGVEIKVSASDIDNIYIKSLNGEIGDIYRWKGGKRAIKCYNDSFFRDQNNSESLEEFKYNRTKNRCFTASMLTEFASKLEMREKTKDKVNNVGSNDELVYESSIQHLLNRYSCMGYTAFEKVIDLNEYKDEMGIYVLCFKDEFKIYIGQTKKSLKNRIVQHFTDPQSEFDKSHSFEEITDIYIYWIRRMIL